MNKGIQYGISILVALALNGCTGGGSGGNTSTPGGAQIAINNTNAPSVGGAVAGATTSSTNLGPTGATIIGGVSVNGKTTNTGLVQLAEWQLTELSKLPPQPTNLIGAVAVSGSQSCSGGGSYSYSYEDADNNGKLSIGEIYSATFNSCIEPNAPESGNMTVVVSSLTGTPEAGAWDANLTMTFSDVTMAGEHLTGDMSFRLSSSNSSDISATVSGSSLSETNSAGKVATLSGYNFTVAYNKITNAYTIGITGTLNRSDLGGSVSFNTSQIMAGNFGNDPDNPTSGILLVTGANNSKLRLTAIDNIYVQLEVDADGDGTYETSSTTTWAEIAPL